MKTRLLTYLFSILSIQVSFAQFEELCVNQTIDGTVVNFIEFNDEIYATGFFQTLCNEQVNYVAKRTPTGWETVGGGLTDPGHHLREIDGELYLARYEESIDSNWLQVLNGDQWEKFGDGIYLTTATNFSNLPNIYDVIQYNGQMLICGEFDRAGSEAISGIAAWNGSQWEAFGGGLSGNIPNTAPVMFPHQMYEFGGDLYVCGNFAQAGGVTVNGIARWDGSGWQAMGEGFDNTVYGIGEYQGELYVGGAFTQSGNSTLERIAKWNGSEWVSPGFGFQPESNFDFIFVHTIKEMYGDLYLGGGLKKLVLEDGTEEPCGGMVAFTGSQVLTFDGGVQGNDIEAMTELLPYGILIGGGVFGNGYLGEVIVGGTPTFEESELNLEIYPNPVSDRLYFSANAEIGKGHLRIFSSLGHEMYSSEAFRMENGLDVSRLLAGNYFISFVSEGKEYRGTFLKQ